MAEIFVDEGLDAIMAIWPKNGTNLSEMFIGLFTSQTATTVPARGATGGSSPDGWTEATGTDYARQEIAAGSWGVQATDGDGRQTTAGQVTFPAAGSGGWGTVNGFFIATADESGVSDAIIYFSNFDDETAVTINAADVIKITPRIKFNG